ncbi:MAG: uncharacterized membrane protein YhaH (DUF805 family) [Limisphaerales bacterium]|jgi:uncharacterized membrane protein YhaH (DUF805 family)
MHWYLDVLKNYAVFQGRASRQQYWMFLLFNLIVTIATVFLDSMVGANGILVLLYPLAVLIPSIAVAIRRLHDTDRSGWWLLIALVPLIGSIWLLVLFVFRGTEGSNQYGEDPHA